MLYSVILTILYSIFLLINNKKIEHNTVNIIKYNLINIDRMGNSWKKENNNANFNAFIGGQNVANFPTQVNHNTKFHSVDSIQKIGNIVNPAKNLQLRDIKIIPKYVYTYTQLEVLDLSFGKISQINEDIGNLVNLRELNLSDNNLTILPNNICNLKKLTTIKLSNNHLTTFQENFGSLINLRTLTLSNNNIVSLPDTFGNLLNLKTLNLNKNNLVVLPETLGNLISLTVLHLEHNSLINLPYNFHHLIDLSQLFLKFNKIELMDENIKLMKNNKNFHIPISSYNINNLSFDCEFIFITDLRKNLTNLPVNMKEIQLYRSKIKNIKVPFNCLLYINGKLITDKN